MLMWLLFRFQTNPDVGGVETITISAPRREFKLASPWELQVEDIGSESVGMLAPHDLIFVKGWSRSLAALTVALCSWENPTFLEARPCLILCFIIRSVGACLSLLLCQSPCLSGLANEMATWCLSACLQACTWKLLLRFQSHPLNRFHCLLHF